MSEAAPNPPTVMGMPATVLRLLPGDILVLQAPHILSVPARANVTDAVSDMLSKAGLLDVRFVVLDPGYRFEVVRKVGEVAHDGRIAFEAANTLATFPLPHPNLANAFIPNPIKVGEVWEIQHSRKGPLTVQFVEPLNDAKDEWAHTRIVEGTAKMLAQMNRLDPPGPGDDLTIRRSLFSFVKRRPDLEQELARAAVMTSAATKVGKVEGDGMCECVVADPKVHADGTCAVCGGQVL